MAKETMKKPTSRKSAAHHSSASGTPSTRRKGGKKRSTKKKKKRGMIIAVEVLLILVVLIGFYVVSKLDQLQHPDMGEGDTAVNEGIEEDTVATMSGYTTVALFGLDTRESGQLGKGNRSDTIIIASINNDTGEVRLASVFRDTYLDMTTGKFNKANSAYSTGGPEQAIKMLNKNLDLDITDFVTVDFNAVIKAVDLLGGIDIDLTDEEVKWLNAYLIETSQVTGVSYENVAASGTQHLSGIQAMAYCRIRYTEGWDYKRTERQRLVLEKIFAAAQAQGVTGLAGLINTMIPYIKTSLSNTEMLALAANIGKYSITDTQGFPYDKQAADVDAGDCVVPVNLASNVSQLHSYLFSESGYTPSDTVQQISNQIINNTGIQ